MENHKFTHKISKGSRFNQVYIPKEMERVFEVGDLVSVELVRKNQQIFFPRNVKLSEFKEKITREIFSFLGGFKEIVQVFLVGSFITQKVDYRDIDLLIIVKGKKDIEAEVYDKLIDKFNLKFHIILIPEEEIKRLSEICPLTRSMFYSYVSNKKFIMPESRLDKSHIRFLMMMPEDLLQVKVGSRVFYDNIRRLITVERFLNKKELNSEMINGELKQSLGKLFEYIKNNEEIDKKIVTRLREIIKIKLNNINQKLKRNEQKR